MTFDERLLDIHGKMLGMELSDSDIAFIEWIDKNKGSAINELRLPPNVTHFVQSGWLM